MEQATATSAYNTHKLSFLTAVFLTLVLCTACVHQIQHSPVSVEQTGSAGELVILVPDSTATRVTKNTLGIEPDIWRFKVGNAVTDVLPKVLNTHYQEVVLVTEKDAVEVQPLPGRDTLTVSVNAFKIDAGPSMTSDHLVNLGVDATFTNNKGETIFNRSFTAMGSSDDAGSVDAAIGIEMPSSGIEKREDAFEMALTDSVVKLGQTFIENINSNQEGL